eukprot:Cvel_20831.t1-p1 / transcript=Cvel_20831.t1 / gene=Cvel_20831 / organism=Chromera_velia_CCMP2878 / gene_product=hypothetical protein / transcript_product=hypothetical protein / location=Cvel_scaffold1906:1-920(-) / protein_length=101 / sequence_SO=supercontig / SO=protein_coding / is_pseudo=false
MKKTAKDKGKGAGAEKSSKTSKAAMPSRSSKDTTPGKDAAASPDEETDEMMVVLKKIDSTRLKRFLIALHRVTLGDFDLYDAFRLWLPVVLGKSFHMCSGE